MDVKFFCLFLFPQLYLISFSTKLCSPGVPSASWALGECWRRGEFCTSMGRIIDRDIAGAGAAWSSWKNLKALLHSVP